MGTKLEVFNKMECVIFPYVFLVFFYMFILWFDDDGQVEI